jgi:excisionase family DNA binding protein
VIKKYLRIAEVADKFGVKRRTIYKWMDEGLPFIRLGRTLRFIDSDIEYWFDRGGGRKAPKEPVGDIEYFFKEEEEEKEDE